tara:strand:+ start:742 stop:1251 length:510 start_codon:yes stop_codon:yes gene_type:complete
MAVFKELLKSIAALASQKSTRKKLKAGEDRKKARKLKSEKELESVDSQQNSPTITRLEASARTDSKKKDIARIRKNAEDTVIPTYNKVMGDFHKANPQQIGGPGNAYGHGKGLGAKMERIIGTTKASVKKTRQLKRENKQVAKQRKQKNLPERRSVKRPKSGLYEDTKQ